MRILVDGDIICYRAAYSTEGETAETAKEKADELMDNIAFDTTTRGEELEVFLTGKETSDTICPLLTRLTVRIHHVLNTLAS